MLFNSYPFALFFLLVWALHRLLPRASHRTLLLAASLVFYFMWIPPYLLLLLSELTINYALLRAMVRSARPKLYLTISVLFSLGVLAFYKYAAFLIASALPVLEWMGATHIETPSILLPLGISFFTFQLIALAVDTYRGEVEPVESLREYILFISFFPQLIAGPILRGSQLLPQLRRGGEVTSDRTRRGLWLLAIGLGKKVLIADLLLAPYVNEVYANPGFSSGAEHLLAIYSFSFQIYFDFAGYTDMARGIGCLLGFELPANFLEPYLSRNPSEYWRRWHITLSTWLRDYLYIPLGGNRLGTGRMYLNLALTMLLGGLWHGAGWNFVIWGGLHGFYLIVHRLLARGRVDEAAPLEWRHAPSILLMFHASAVAYVFFRAPTFVDAVQVFSKTLMGEYAGHWPLLQVIVVASCIALHGLERYLRVHFDALRERLAGFGGAALEGAALGALLVLVAIFGGDGGEFIYFQF